MVVPRALFLASLLGAASALSGFPHGRPHAQMLPMPSPPMADAPVVPVTDVNGTELPPLTTIYTFEQLIDHNNPSAGTFTQRYYHTWQFYVAGGPIIIFTPGEANFQGYSGYLSNTTVNGRFAQENGGATIVLEHRFFGFSNPKPDLTDESLKLHTIDQAVDDLVYFAKNVKLPMPGGDQVTPDKAPWILVGGSYSGALTSWVMNARPGVFWAGYSSSGVVETLTDFWGYFEPIRQHGPKNCTNDVISVISHVDEVLSKGTPEEIFAVKSNFGMANLTHLDDVAGALRFNLFDWQSLSPTSPRSALFYRFCDAIEVKDGVVSDEKGWGLEHAFKAWGTFWNTTYMDLTCGPGADVVDCLGTYDPTQAFWHNTTINNSGRSWTWFVCNWVGYFFDGAPQNWPSLTTRLVQPEYDERQCTYWFDKKLTKPTPPETERTNRVFKGWEGKVDRLFFANGARDPWREATMSTDFVNIASTETQPIAMSDGFHCTDLIISAGTTDVTVKQVQDLASAYMGKWVAEWHAANPKRPKGVKHTFPDPRTLPHPGVKRVGVPSSIANAPAGTAPSLPVTPGRATGSHRTNWALRNPMIRQVVRV
ncbi:hypothetical protein EXIGLDRAFT_639437 [Exidia glandulosa HHB12029]|uniref:Peptidase S28 n=1 Tax=Exidia glandulosa HHB12029 TaxID=1314781 RepID=A0A165N8K9_EXIGL|nr:hypothetical protein EXIGLDRAFT_639437 [Exidia glandulosa HHB12029]